MEWQPIETAPVAGAWALVYADGAVNCMYVQKGKLPEDWTRPACPNVVPSHVTHWMAIPPAPTAPEK